VTRQRVLVLVVVGAVALVFAVAALGALSSAGHPSDHFNAGIAQGPRAVPGDVLRHPGIPRHAVLLAGATTVAELRVLEPGNAARLFAGTSPDEPVYAVFVYQGRNAEATVSLHPDTFTSRLLLDQDGNALAGVSWASRTKPFPTQPFGTQFDVAPE
jgi:hypothetical protein